MPKIALAAYSVRIRDTHSKDYYKLDDIVPQKDFLEFVTEYFKFIDKELSHDEENKRLLLINNKSIKSNNRQLTGIMKTGEYGYESEIINNKLGNLKYKRKVDDAEMLPFYFLLSLPKNKDKGIVILQRFGLFGISKIFQTSLNQFLRSRINPSLTLEFIPLVSTNVIKQFINTGAVTKVIFRRFDIPSDLADYFDNKDLKEVKGHAEFSIVANRNSILPIKRRLNRFMFGDGKVDRLMEIKSFPYDNVKVEIKRGNDTRTIDLGNLNSFRSYYDVTDEVKTGKNGHPIFESIDESAKKLLKEMNELLYPDQNV